MVDQVQQGRAAILTGASGYIGSRLASRLVADGWQVHAILREGSRAPAGCVAHGFDGTYGSVAAAFKAAGQVAAVFHLAAHVASAHSADDLPALVAGNLTLPLLVLEAASAHEVPLFVNTGSHWQHADGTDDYAPFGLYGAAKQATDDLALWFVRDRGLRVVTLKLFDVYGSGDPRKKIIPLLIEAAASGTRLPMSPGHQVLDFVHVDDVVEAFLAVAETAPAPDGTAVESYAVRSGEETSLREVVGMIESVSGRSVDVRWGELPYRPNQIMRPWSGRRTVPGWTPRVGLRDGIARLCRDAGFGDAARPNV